jgi:hypothetical protein
MTPQLCEEMLERTATAIGRARDQAVAGRSATAVPA